MMNHINPKQFTGRLIYILFLLIISHYSYCQISPVNPNATNDACKVLSYLDDLTDERRPGVVSGQNVEHGDEMLDPEPDEGWSYLIEQLHANTGKWVGMAGVDYEFTAKFSVNRLQNANVKLKEYWNEGGLITINWTPRNYFYGGDYSPMQDPPNGPLNGQNFRDLITPGKPEYDQWIGALNRIAEALLDLRDAGVVVIWRPMQEMNNPSMWFARNTALGKGDIGAQEWKDVWIHMYNYFTNDKGLNNLLWNYSGLAWQPNASAETYPGDQYVDIISITSYHDELNIPNYNTWMGYDKPLGAAEYGRRIPNAGSPNFDNTKYRQKLQNDYPGVAYWMTWHDWSGVNMSLVRNQNESDLLNHSYVLTRDELQWQNSNGCGLPIEQTPYTILNIPGKIEGEFYDNGGQGVAYNDTSTGNTGGALRSDDVDVGAKAGASNGHSVGWSASGEWLEYTLASVTSGTYDLEFSYASGAGGSVGDLKVELDGVLLGTFTNLTSDGNWNNFRTATLPGITVSGGSDKVLRLEYVNGASFDIDAIEFITSGGGGCSAGNKTESAVDAVYTQNGTVFNNNDLRVEQNNRVTYVKFDVDGICTPVTSATLRFDNNDSGNGTFKVFLGSHNSWDDNTSNAGSLPSKGAELASKSGSIGTGQLDFNLSTSAIDNGEITFIVEQTSSGNDIKMSSDNVGNSNDHPKLIIDYGSGAGSRLGTSTLSAADELGGVIIYPNPSNGHFVVKGITAFKSVSLFNKVGQLMDLETKLTAEGLEIISPSLSQGTYVLRVIDGIRPVVYKVLIE